MEIIDSWVNERIKSEGLKDELQSYDEIIKEIKGVLKIPKIANPSEAIEKIFDYIAIFGKIMETQKLKMMYGQ